MAQQDCLDSARIVNALFNVARQSFEHSANFPTVINKCLHKHRISKKLRISKYINLLSLIMLASIPQQILKKVIALAQEYVDLLIPFSETIPLIKRGDDGQFKFDRIDSKLVKEAEKLNKKQSRAVKLQEKAKQRIGAVTYKSYSIAFKKKLITEIREEVQRSGQTLSKIIRNRARQLQIHPKNITRWYHTKELKKKQGGRRALYPQMEIRLANFIINNPKMKRKHILRQARQIMDDLNIPDRDKFNFSKGWYERFRERLNKKKVAKGLRPEDLLKIEAKQQGYDVKKEQYASFMDNDQGYDESDEESEELVKFEENFSDSQQKDQSFFNVKHEDLSGEQSIASTQVKQEQLFFESDQQQKVKQEQETSTDRMIREEKVHMVVNSSNIINQ